MVLVILSIFLDFWDIKGNDSRFFKKMISRIIVGGEKIVVKNDLLRRVESIKFYFWRWERRILSKVNKNF